MSHFETESETDIQGSRSQRRAKRVCMKKTNLDTVGTSATSEPHFSFHAVKNRHVACHRCLRPWNKNQHRYSDRDKRPQPMCSHSERLPFWSRSAHSTGTDCKSETATSNTVVRQLHQRLTIASPLATSAGGVPCPLFNAAQSASYRGPGLMSVYGTPAPKHWTPRDS